MFDPKTRVLVVDDMVTMRLLLKKTCKELGFMDVVEASGGAEAWEVIVKAKVPFGLILADVSMPGFSGMELLKRVRSDRRYAKLPFVFVSSGSEQTSIVDAIRAGANSYIVKPFTQEAMKKQLEQVYARLNLASSPSV